MSLATWRKVQGCDSPLPTYKFSLFPFFAACFTAGQVNRQRIKAVLLLQEPGHSVPEDITIDDGILSSSYVPLQSMTILRNRQRNSSGGFVQIRRRRRHAQPGRRRRLSLLGHVLLFILFVASYILYNSHQTRVALEMEALLDQRFRDCSLQDLQQSFAVPRTTTVGDDASCWQVKEEIVQVPVESIVNRNHMRPLGAGYKGTVRQALIQLKHVDDNNNFPNEPSSPDLCWAALKSDHCHILFWSNLFFDRTGISCVQDGAFLWNDASYLGGEYNGAMLSAAARRKFGDNHHQALGLLPTFGIVVRDRPLWTRYSRDNLQGMPHPNRLVVGSIMPLHRSLVKLRAYGQLEPQHFLPSARLLQFAAQMNMAFQDMIDNNIGVDKATGETFLYDYTYLALQNQEPGSTCTAGVPACTYCPDAALTVGATYPQHRFPKTTAVESDFLAYRNIVARYLRRHGDASNLTRRKVQSCATVEDLVQVLKNAS